MGTRFTPFSLLPLLYGRDGLDIKLRLWADQRLETVNPYASPEQRFRWTARFGIGIPEIMGVLPRYTWPLFTFFIGLDIRLCLAATGAFTALRLMGLRLPLLVVLAPLLLPLVFLFLRLLRYLVAATSIAFASRKAQHRSGA
jgi:hypothetical protein